MSVILSPLLVAPSAPFWTSRMVPVSPVLELPAAQQLLGLALDARRLLAVVLRQLGGQAGAKFQASLTKNKVFMASYWSDVSFHARFAARALDSSGRVCGDQLAPAVSDQSQARSSRATVRNPVLALPAAQQASGLPPASRRLLGSLLRDLGRECRDMMKQAISRRRLKWAAYWHASSVYAKHIARVIDPRT